jgi:hypothetical protein
VVESCIRPIIECVHAVVEFDADGTGPAALESEPESKGFIRADVLCRRVDVSELPAQRLVLHPREEPRVLRGFRAFRVGS